MIVDRAAFIKWTRHISSREGLTLLENKQGTVTVFPDGECMRGVKVLESGEKVFLEHKGEIISYIQLDEARKAFVEIAVDVIPKDKKWMY